MSEALTRVIRPDEPPTPAFVVDLPALDDVVSGFRDALDRHWANSVLSYSFKTNSLPWLLSYMQRRGVWAEVVSDSEYQLALAIGFAPDRIVFNGPVKSRECLRSALLHGSIINLDSKREVRWTAELAAERPDLALRAGLRVNWDLEARCAGESTLPGSSSRFGFNDDNGELGRAITMLESAGVRVAGLHMHRNSRTQSLEVFRAAAAVAAEITTSHQLRLDWIDIGGGFFSSPGGTPTFDEYISAIREELAGSFDIGRTQLIVEPGGALIAVPVELHAQVIDVKEVDNQRFVITDISRTDIDPQFRREKDYRLHVETGSTESVPEQVICGFTCMENDRLTVLKKAPLLREDDRIVFERVGAYTMSYRSTFIEFPPAVYVRRGESLEQVRRKGTAEDLLRGNTWSESA
ncbi:hypothetical protein QYM46_17295 [Brevibacterium sp. K11IcPPYGO002]|uniref:hypothetical protein n=1 Tax=Brevibacterium sp. K11IcPPYGO002 TaxID=3058837 RepID=UPI003D8157D7